MISAPLELVRRPQWVAWRLEQTKDDKPTKVPYSAHGGRASTTDRRTWATFEEAAACAARERLSGVGFVVDASDPYVGIDLDHCRDTFVGEIEDWAQEIVAQLNSYTEITPSGTGLRIFVRGELPPSGRKKGNIEMYAQARFLTVTGQHLPGTPETIEDRPAEILAVHHATFGQKAPSERRNGSGPTRPFDLADADLLFKARSASNGARFWALWNGDWSSYSSQSEADAALLSDLAFYVGPDAGRLDSLFRSSGLMREKWDREDYRDRTINFVLEGKTEFWQAPSAPLSLLSTNGTAIRVNNLPESAWRTLGEVTQTAPDSTRQLIERFLWEGTTLWTYSSPGAGKTLFWMAALIHMAAGKPFCGREVIQGPVLMIEEDSSDSIISSYAQMLADIYDFDLDMLPFWVNRFRGIRITDMQCVDVVRDMIAHAPQKPAVLALDACERLVPSERFNSKELDPLAQLFSLNQMDGIANLMIDHTRKVGTGENKPDPIDMLYGGRTKSAISDVMMYFSGAIKNQALITFPKFRGDEPAATTVSFDGSAGFSLKEGRPKLNENERMVMMVLTNAFGEMLTREQLDEKTGLKHDTTIRALNKLISIGYAKRVGENRDAVYGTDTPPSLFE